MLGFSFGEILIIAIIAVLFLGPDKLPKAFVDIAKFFRAVKKTINDAKDALDREVHISEIKQEALEYKKKFQQGAENIKKDVIETGNLDEIKDILNTPLENSLESKNTTNNTINTIEEIELEAKKMTPKINLKTKTATSKTKKPESSVKSNVESKKTPKTAPRESKPKTTSKAKKVVSTKQTKKPKLSEK